MFSPTKKRLNRLFIVTLLLLFFTLLSYVD
jgi:hypothetical protein